MAFPLLHRRAFTVHALSALLLAATAARAGAAQPVAGRITVAVGGRGALYHLPLLIAERLGFFRAEGLDVVLADYAGGGDALRGVQQGAADVCSGAYEHTIRMQLLGQSWRAFVLQTRTPQMALAVSLRALPRYQSLADLRGKRVGVSSPGSSTHWVSAYMLARAGVAQQEVEFVGVGSGEPAIAALRTGKVQALCQPDPMISVLEQKADVRIAGETRTLKDTQNLFGGLLPSGSLYAPQVFLQQRAAEVQALTNGIAHALKWLQTASPADMVRTVPEGVLLGERALYLAAFEKVRETYSPHGLMPEGGPAHALRAMAAVSSEVATARIDLGRTYSNEWAARARQKFNL